MPQKSALRGGHRGDRRRCVVGDPGSQAPLGLMLNTDGTSLTKAELGVILSCAGMDSEQKTNMS